MTHIAKQNTTIFIFTGYLIVLGDLNQTVRGELAKNNQFSLDDLQTASEVANHFGYDYPHGDDKRVSEFLLHIRELPPDAVSF